LVKASTLVKLLEKAIELHGDLIVTQDLAYEGLNANTVGVYIEDDEIRLADDYLQLNEDIEEYFGGLRKKGRLIEIEEEE
jgi:hypothetical protein